MTSDPRDAADTASDTTTPSSDEALETAEGTDGEVNDVVPMPQDPDDSLQSGDGVTGETSD